MSCGCNNRNTSNHSLNRVYSSCCNQCRRNPCCCPEPTCQTSSCESVCTALVSDNSWNVPACDAEAVISFPGLTTILIGTYLYNPTYGRFLVNGFNSINGEVTVENTCLAGNAAPGTMVPSGTEFVFGQEPQLTEWTDWTPVLTASGAMTVSAVAIAAAEYFTIGNTVFFQVNVQFNLGGVASTDVYVSLPLTGATAAGAVSYPAILNDSSGVQNGSWSVDETDGTRLIVHISNSPNIALGGTYIGIQGFYQLA